MASIHVIRDNQSIASAQGCGEVNLFFAGAFRPGDIIEVKTDTPYVCVKLDAAIDTARLYLPQQSFTYRLPLAGDGLLAYPPYAFCGERHLLCVQPDDHLQRRNLALNPLDQREESGAYPHASANVETRDESVFFARNVLDGITVANGHGEWPYQSWGIGARTDASLRVDFGRAVLIDAVDLYLRADFPHDAYWTQAVLAFSDGEQITFTLKDIDGRQRVMVGDRRVQSLELTQLVKSNAPSAFPALKQLAVWGRDADQV